ncbi:MAG: filamentous hemagglutinin, partial [Moorea sp. SIO3C2]|nr:filamentous hemagglutinin [Moorena sp. SIO3C2]
MAPDGAITVAAVADSQRVRLQRAGQVLTLEVEPWSQSGLNTVLEPTQLPAMLTGLSQGHADVLTVEADGTMRLTQAGTIIASEPGHVSLAGDIYTRGIQGGQISILGDNVSLIDATLRADGHQQGGRIHVGGSYQGSGPMPNADYTWISSDSHLSANALGQGDGGHIIVWADQSTQFRGNVEAEGGPLGGDGGFIEVSGKSRLVFDGQFSLQAPQGEAG